jgi:hypothetical protein
MHAVIISRQLKDSLKGENLGYNLGPYMGDQYQVQIPSSALFIFAKVNLF